MKRKKLSLDKIKAKLDSLETTVERAKELAITMTGLAGLGYVCDAKRLFYASAAFAIVECGHVIYCNHRINHFRKKYNEFVGELG